MFMLAPEERGIAGDCVHVLGAAGFALTVGAGLAAIWLPAQLPRVGEMIGYGAIASAVVIYLWDVLRIYRTRKRAVIEAHNRAAVGAFVLLGIATGLGVGFLGSGTLEVGGPVVVFLVLFGWLGGLGLTQLYKIVPFLTWLSRYGSSLGRGAVPRVQDLVKESRSYPWFSSYFLGAFIATLAVLIGWLQAFRACFALMTIATVGLAIEYWRAWRGSYVHPTPAVPAAPPFLSIKEVDRD